MPSPIYLFLDFNSYFDGSSSTSLTDWLSTIASIGTLLLLWWTLRIQIKLEKQQHVFFENEAKKWRLSMLPDFKVTTNDVSLIRSPKDSGIVIFTFSIMAMNNKANNFRHCLSLGDTSYKGIDIISPSINVDPEILIEIYMEPILIIPNDFNATSAIRNSFVIDLHYEDIAGHEYVKKIEYSRTISPYGSHFKEHTPIYILEEQIQNKSKFLDKIMFID